MVDTCMLTFQRMLSVLSCFHDVNILQSLYQRLVHAGVSHTLSQVRQEFWIPQGRAEVRRVLSRCVICKRHGGA